MIYVLRMVRLLAFKAFHLEWMMALICEAVAEGNSTHR